MDALKPFLLRDEVHGDLELDGRLRCVVDHEAFQRLRYIKQGGLAEYVYPCSTHTRFQHSLGAGFLASRYFDSLLHFWTMTPLRWTAVTGSTRLLGEYTEQIASSVNKCEKSRSFWRLVVTLASLLHDVGHGPWSHAFEALPLKRDVSASLDDLPKSIAAYFRRRGDDLGHEDFSVLYVVRILRDTRDALGLVPLEAAILAVASLVNKKLYGAERERIEATIATELNAAGLVGGPAMLRLLRPIVSGPFDVDRMDYIQRDARNCGVSIGGIEWLRILRKVVPCLAEHQNDRGEPEDVVLVSHVKNQHVIDDFVFSLFQMYTQVYLHPKVVGLEESLRVILENSLAAMADYVVTLDEHQTLTDERFRWLLRDRFQIRAVDDLLFRKSAGRFRVLAFPAGTKNQQPPAPGYELLEVPGRAMWKDGTGVFLYSALSEKHRSGAGSPPGLWAWTDVSPVAGRFRDVQFVPQFWIDRSDAPS